MSQEPIIPNTRQSYRIHIANCSLQPAEMKTRFNLVYDKCVQFIVSSELCTEIGEKELLLIKFSIKMALGGFTHGSSLLLWALDHMRPMNLKVFVIKKLVAHEGSVASLGYDTKMVRF